MTALDANTHRSVFDPAEFGDRRIDVIGAGAAGSRIVLELARLGAENIHVWDFDHVELKNVSNQEYWLEHVGRLKVDALAELVERVTGLTIQTHAERVDGTQELGDVVFLLTDTMASRKEIWEGAIRYKTNVKIMIETRMGVQSFYVYLVNPLNRKHIKDWESTLFEDEDGEESACGTRTSVGPTAGAMANRAVWQFMRWFACEELGKVDDELDFELLESLRQTEVATRPF